MSTSELICPFCKEPDYDAPGLKDHLNGNCDEMNKVKTLRQEHEERLRVLHNELPF